MQSRNERPNNGAAGGVVPLSNWINRALDNIAASCEDDLAVSSEAYIIPALRIASSLAKQICKAEEESLPPISTRWFESIDNLQINLPVPDSNWSSKVVVLGGDVDRDSNTNTVASAKLLSTETVNCSNTPQEKLMRIYSLGLVFYEIFSGGDRPMLHHCSEISPQVDDIIVNPLPIGQVNTHEMNLAEALKIIDDLDDNNDLQIPPKKALQSKNSAISSELLKMKKIPCPLCDLVASMLDCVNGGFSDSETYRSMSDVLVDLQLMLDKPAIFLRGIDLDKVSSNELHFSDSMFGRETKLSVVTNAYKRSLLSSDEKELAVVTGPAGSGKSFLSQRFGDYVTASGGLFLSAKFDQLKQSRPLSALASAFNDYCVMLSRGDGGDNGAASLASEMRVKLRDDDIFHLTRIIPSLVNILNQGTCFSFSEGNECQVVDAQQRLQFLMCQFVEAITMSTSVPITFQIDDLHNADDASVGVINQLIVTSKSTKRVFFLISSREDEKLLKVLTNLDHFEVPHVQIKMDNLDELEINKTMSELLHLSPRLTRRLSSIAHHKTRGNALFFSRWMMSLVEGGLLQPSLSRRRWVWDEDEIQGVKLPDDVAMLFRDSIYKLSDDVQDALSVMACFGASLDDVLVDSLEQALPIELITPLNIAVKEGLLDKINCQYRFCHDYVQDAAYNVIMPQEKCLHHFQHGLSLAKLYLVEVSMGQDNDDTLFAAVNQLNLGGPAALDPEVGEEGFTVSMLNLKAGKKAMEMSDFKAAYSFFDNGISFLRKRHWQQHYELSIELFCLASKCALATGDFVSLKLLSEQVLRNANAFEQKIPVMYYCMCARTFSGEFFEGAKQIESTLSQLGEALPEQSSSSEILNSVEEMLETLASYSVSELKDLKRMNDSVKKTTMLFLKQLNLCYFNINPEKQPIVTTKMIQLTLSHGMCETSPLAFALFGSMLGKLGNIEKGYQYTKLAKQLVEENTFYESSGVVLASASQLLCYVEPVQAVVPLFIEARERSMSAGDAANACISMLYYINEAYVSGVDLLKLKEKCFQARQLVKQLGHFAALSHLVIIERHLQSLMGATWEGEHHVPEDEEEVNEANPHAIYYSIVYKLINNFMFRRYSATESFLRQFLAHNRVDWTLMLGQSDVTFLFGLVVFWITRVSKEPNLKHAGIEAKEAMQGWTNSSQWNFEHKLLLLDAEENFCDGNFDQAKTLYQKAIESAKEHRFVNGEALACELAGYFYLEMGDENTANDYFIKAHERYETWGASGKATSLNQEIKKLSTEDK